MKIVKASAEIISPLDQREIMEMLERCGRVCYKSEDRITDGSADAFLSRIIKNGHDAVLEHCSFTAKFICDRGISHEIVRHRLAAYCQESTRYCNYGNGEFGAEITVVEPCYLTPGTEGYRIWEDACAKAEASYFRMLEWGAYPQEARAVLPTSLKTELVMTADIREWRHFFRLRCGASAHPQMREVAMMLLDEAAERLPVLFGDICEEVHRRRGK